MANVQTHTSNTGKYVIVYICILAIAAFQFVIGLSNADTAQMFTRMLSLAIIEAALALLFFMHLSDNRGLMWFVIIFIVSVLLGMQYGWTDSFRIINGAPWAK